MADMETTKWFWVHVWEGWSVSYIRWLKSCTYHILHMAKSKSALECTQQPTLVAWRDGLSNLENASVPSLHPAFQSALYHAMKRKKKNNQWESAQTGFNTKVVKWWRRRIAWFYRVAWVTYECSWRVNPRAARYTVIASFSRYEYARYGNDRNDIHLSFVQVLQSPGIAEERKGENTNNCQMWMENIASNWH